MARFRILLVEPLAWLRDVEEELLVRKGYHVCTAGTGADALVQASFHPPAVGLIRYSLPDQTGTKLLRSLQEAGVYAPMIGITGRKEHRADFEAAGAFSVLVMPFHDVDMIREIKSALSMPIDFGSMKR